MGDVFNTVVAGVGVLVMGQLLLRAFVEPVLEVRRAVGRVIYGLRYYADVVFNAEIVSDDEWRSAARFWRDTASIFAERQHALIGYSFWAKVGLVPSSSALKEATRNMIGLSNSKSSRPELVLKRYRIIRDTLDIEVDV